LVGVSQGEDGTEQKIRKPNQSVGSDGVAKIKKLREHSCDFAPPPPLASKDRLPPSSVRVGVVVTTLLVHYSQPRPFKIK